LDELVYKEILAQLDQLVLLGDKDQSDFKDQPEIPDPLELLDQEDMEIQGLLV
jgi:hypothetical protein